MNPSTHRMDRPQRRSKPGAPPGQLTTDPDAPAPRVSVLSYGPDGVDDRTDIRVEDALALRGSRPVLWINVDGLGDADTILAIGEAFGLHALALEDVVNSHQRPKVEEYEDHLFLVARMPAQGRVGATEQVSLFLGEGFVLTFQERPGDCFDPVRERIRMARGRIRGRGADYLAYALLDGAIDAFFPVLETIAGRIDRLEDEVMREPRPGQIERIHTIKRELQSVRRAVWPQREMLNLLIRDETPFFTDETQIYLRDCFDHTFQLVDLVETYREIVTDLRDIYLSAQSTRMNEIMKVLTIIATIFLPLTLISGIYGMNFDTRASPWNMPELGWRLGYPYVIVLMLAIACGMLVWFWWMGWLGGRPRRRRLRGR